jgi:hypothetical protein
MADDFDTPETEDEEGYEDEPEGESSVIRRIRTEHKEEKRARKRLEKELQSIQQERDSLRRETRKFSASSVFKEAGLPEQQVELFLATSGDEELTTDSVKGWAERYGLAPKPQTQEAPQAFEPTVTAEPAAPGRMTREQLDQKVRAGELTMNQAHDLIKQNRVQFDYTDKV